MMTKIQKRIFVEPWFEPNRLDFSEVCYDFPKFPLALCISAIRAGTTDEYEHKCEINKCVCPEGEQYAATGKACSDHGTKVCNSCPEKYHLEKGTCKQICPCPNGYPTDVCSKEATDVNPSCDRCKTGYGWFNKCLVLQIIIENISLSIWILCIT